MIQSTRKGMALTWKHAWDARKQRTQHNIQDESYFAQSTGIATLQYPHIDIPTPDNGRYQLHNEMDDCIVCDKCVKVCPVDCIDIEPIKATGLVGHASDGSPIRLYAAKFDIDMSKCCFCGLCTTVCPTECLTMTSEYDFSVFEVKEHNFSFANLTAEEAEEKKRLYEQFVAEKEAMKQAVISPESEGASPKSEVPSPEVKKAAFKPSFKPKVVASPKSGGEEPTSNVQSESEGANPESEGESPTSDVQRPASSTKPAFKPSFKPKSNVQSPASDVQRLASNESEVRSPEEAVAGTEVKKPAFKPSFKAKAKDPSLASDVQRPASNESNVEPPASNVQSPTSDS